MTFVLYTLSHFFSYINCSYFFLHARDGSLHMKSPVANAQYSKYTIISTNIGICMPTPPSSSLSIPFIYRSGKINLHFLHSYSSLTIYYCNNPDLSQIRYILCLIFLLPPVLFHIHKMDPKQLVPPLLLTK